MKTGALISAFGLLSAVEAQLYVRYLNTTVVVHETYTTDVLTTVGYRELKPFQVLHN